MIDLPKALAPLKDDRLFQKAGIVFGLYLAIFLISLLFNVTTYFSSSLLGIFPNADRELLNILVEILSILIVILVTFPVSIYLLGYQFRIADAVRKGKESTLPEHDSIWGTCKLGVVYSTLGFIMLAPLVIIGIIVFVLSLGVVVSLSDTSNGSSGMVLGGVAGLVIITLMLGVLTFLVSTILMPACMYVYLKTGKLSAALSFSRVRDVISAAWLPFLIIAGLRMILSFAMGVVMLVTCCAGPILRPLLDTLTLLVCGGLFGAVFHEIEITLPVSEG